MPIYEYRCKDCREKFDVLRSMRDTQPAVCPTCQSSKTERQLSVFAAHTNNSSSNVCETSQAWGGTCCGGGCGLN